MGGYWTELLVGQLEFYWDASLRPRLEGLTDEEYFWEPVEGCWSLRRSAEGRYALEHEWPEPSPPPVTTIAWRIVHIGAYCLANRANAFFGAGESDGDMFDPRYVPAELPGSAARAVEFLEGAYHQWRDGVRGLDEARLRQPLGPKGAQFAADPMAALVLHIHREVMHHGGEIGALRDLYRATGATTRHGRLTARG